MKQITLVVPYYKNPSMMARQIAEWENWSDEARAAFQIVIVDDGSPPDEYGLSMLICDHAYPAWIGRFLHLYRVDTDIPWNQHGARNLGAHVADTPWLMMIDIDHVVPAGTADAIARNVALFEGMQATRDQWFKFPRIRIGAADETRAKDGWLGIPPEATDVPIGPGLNIYLCPRDAYWRAGGYNEDFCGTLCGDSQFLRELANDLGPPVVLDCPLHVHTRHSIPDANTTGLSRDPEPGRKLVAAAKRAGTVKGHAPYMRFPWHRVF